MTATLIDNIFINDISCHSQGGNITSSISDHYFQFSQTDILRSPKHAETVKYVRDFGNFGKHEFNEELVSIDWSDIFNENAELSYQRFYMKMEDILNYMARK